MLLTTRQFVAHLCLMTTIVIVNAFLSEISIAQSLASNDLIKRLATIPGQKPSNLVHVNIQDYTIKGEEEPRWEKSPIPSFLTEADRSRYRVLFRIQKEGEWRLADRIISTLENTLLMGHVLA
ncbi:MAG: hypothetical protein VX617_06710, partial [Pseudomonadota bacterium]|nr:hypothetical protein [Pseudomonadota bacterium]